MTSVCPQCGQLSRHFHRQISVRVPGNILRAGPKPLLSSGTFSNSATHAHNGPHSVAHEAPKSMVTLRFVVIFGCFFTAGPSRANVWFIDRFRPECCQGRHRLGHLYESIHSRFALHNQTITASFETAADEWSLEAPHSTGRNELQSTFLILTKRDQTNGLIGLNSKDFR